jgi:uncharacterized protein
VGCRARRPKRALLRIVRTTEGEVRLDPTGRIPGRGAYVDRDPACVEAAVRKGTLARVLRASLAAEDLATLRDEMRNEMGRA